jgi:hypothetical protein
MKKFINILIIFPLFAFAGLDIPKVNSALSSIKSSTVSSVPLKFYNNNMSLNLNDELKLTSQSSADIVLFPKRKKINKAFVVDSYKALKKYKNSIGAIYIKKGRTQIVFVEERLKDNGFDLTKMAKKYLIQECKLQSICLVKK